MGKFSNECYLIGAGKSKGCGGRKFGVGNAECGVGIVSRKQLAVSGVWGSKILLFLGNHVCFGRVIIVFGNC